MPFVKKQDTEDSKQPIDGRKLFIGRTSELRFFIQHILKPEDPSHNILSIWGQGGVGKSTLLVRLIEEARTPAFQDYCLAALVDERHTTLIRIMEQFAYQLHLSGAFAHAMKQYKEALRQQSAERGTVHETLLQRGPDAAGAVVEWIPIVGPLLREGAKITTAHLASEYHRSQIHKDTERLDRSLENLTKAFIADLNHLADGKVTLSSRKRRWRRVILCFDTFEQLALDAVPWLLDYFLPAEISRNVVLVVAGRDALAYATPGDAKRWLSYDETIYSMALNSFTEDETRAYLAERGITDATRMTTIWQVSQGLPLYLGLLTSNLTGKVDPMKDVVDNFLRWIPEQEHIKRQVALDAALFSRPFNQDDFEAFAYVPMDERPALYRWLIGQPFVRAQDGRYSYHDLAKELFSRHLYQHSRKGYYATRQALASHYQQLFEEIQRAEGREAYRSAEWFELLLALIPQLFLVPDEASHIKAIEQVLYVDTQTRFEKHQEIVRMLRELSGTSFSDISLHAQRIIRCLQQLFKLSSRGQVRLEAATFLLNTAVHEPSFPPALLGQLYEHRGWAYQGLKQYQQSIDDFQHNLALLGPSAHRDRGLAYWDLGLACWDMEKFQQAIDEFTLALEQDPHDTRTLGDRGWNYYYRKEYQQALDDFERALKQNPNDTRALHGRGRIHEIFKEYKQALAHYEHIVEVTPADTHGYTMRGWMYMYLKEYQRAITDFDYALELDPQRSFSYYRRGFVYLWQNDMKQAWADFTRSRELDPLVRSGWVAEWVRMCQLGASSQTPERLEALIEPEQLEALIANASHPRSYYPRVCLAVVHLLRGGHEEAIAELEQAISLPQDELWDAYFWKGMACVFLGREEEAMEVIEKALEEGMPPVLLTPLHWFKRERPNFYETCAMPLLARYE